MFSSLAWTHFQKYFTSPCFVLNQVTSKLPVSHFFFILFFNSWRRVFSPLSFRASNFITAHMWLISKSVLYPLITHFYPIGPCLMHAPPPLISPRILLTGSWLLHCLCFPRVPAFVCFVFLLLDVPLLCHKYLVILFVLKNKMLIMSLKPLWA